MSLVKSFSPRHRNMKALQPTTNKDGVPLLFHEPHVERGFRPPNQPWICYLLSVFQLHNEMMNTWTHLIALWIVLARGFIWWIEFPLLADPYMWPLSVGVLTMIILYSCSSFAHCFQNRSELAHYTCFMIDYAGIGLYGFGSAMLHWWYCLHEDLLGSFSHEFAIPIAAFLGVTTCLCCAISKTKYKRPYPFIRRVWQIGSVGTIYCWLNIPIWYRIYMYLHDGVWESSFSDHIQQMTWFTMAGFFFSSDIPQRFSPGTFDIFCHGHQLFHVCIMLTTMKQMDAVYLEITDGSVVTHSMEAPTFLNTFGWLLFVILANMIIVFYFHSAMRKALVKEAMEKGDSFELWDQTIDKESIDDNAGLAHSMLDRSDLRRRKGDGENVDGSGPSTSLFTDVNQISSMESFSHLAAISERVSPN